MATQYSSVILAFKSELQKTSLPREINNVNARHSWNDGRSLGLRGALVIPPAVFDLCQAGQKDIQQYQSALKHAKDAANALLDNAKATASGSRLSRLRRAEAEKTRRNRELDNKIGALIAANLDLSAQRKEEEKEYQSLGLIPKRMKRAHYEERFRIIDDAISKNNAQKEALKATRSKITEEHRRELDSIEADYNSAFAIANREYQNTIDEFESLYQSRVTQIALLLRDALQGLTTEDQIEELQAHCSSIRPSYERFHSLDAAFFESPGDFYLGSATLSDAIVDEGQLNGLSEYFYEIISSDDGEKQCRIEVPFTVELAQGLQIIVDSEDSETGWVNELIRLLTIRLLMSYPAGKLQLTLIDPLRNGLSFAGITGIVDRDHDHLIGGGVLTQTRFIDAGLSALQLKMAGFSQSYGRNREAYFKREPIQAVVINDFPSGFSKSSLENLAKMMKNGRDFGTIFIIGVNNAYTGDFARDSNYKAIMSEIDASHNDFLLGGSMGSLTLNDTRIQINIGDGQLVADNEDAILSELRRGIRHSVPRKEAFEQLFTDLYNPNTWRRDSSVSGIDIPIGVEGASNVVQISVGRPGTAHHGLITGATGSGKSTALHAMIMSTIIKYSPDEVRFVLIDFKEGTEFRDYALYQIPSFLSITTTTEPEFALAALKDIEDEFEHRTSTYDHGDIQEYRSRHPGAKAPRIVLLFDEVQALFAESVRQEIRDACLAILTTLVTQGRSVGLHVFLASQNFERVPMLRPLMSDMQIRLCIKDTDTGGILESADALRDAPVGSAILNNGGGVLAAGQTLFQVCYLDDDERHGLLTQLSEIHESLEMIDRYRDYETRLLFTDIMDNRFHPFNQFIDEGLIRPAGSLPHLHLGSCLKLTGGENPYSLTGLDFAIDLDGNLVLVGNNSDIATSICTSIVLSGVLDTLFTKRANDRIDIYDFTEGDMFVGMASKRSRSRHITLADLSSAMPEVVHRIDTSEGFNGSPYLDRIDELYSMLEERRTIDAPSSPRVLSILYGIDSAISLMTGDTFEGGTFGSLGALPKLQKVLKEGPRFGLFTVVWGQSHAAVEGVLNSNSAGPAKNYFGNRVIFSASQEDFKDLGMCLELPATKQGAYFFSRRGRAYFRPFDPPTPEWIQAFCNGFEDSWMG